MENSQLGAVECNNHAVSLIEAGQMKSAINFLTKALKCSKQILNCIQSENHECNKIMNTSLDECLRRGPVLTDKENVSTEDKTREEQFFSRRAICIPYPMGPGHDASVKTSAMIVYNLALAYQMSAKSHTTSTNFNLRKAIKLYELAYQLQSEIEGGSNVLFAMTTLTNLGIAHQSLDDSVMAAKFFQHVISMLMFLIDAGTEPMSELGGFFRTAFVHVFQPRTAAAA